MPCGGGRSSECCLSTKGAVRRGAVFREQRGCLQRGCLSATRGAELEGGLSAAILGRYLGCYLGWISRLDLASRTGPSQPPPAGAAAAASAAGAEAASEAGASAASAGGV